MKEERTPRGKNFPVWEAGASQTGRSLHTNQGSTQEGEMQRCNPQYCAAAGTEVCVCVGGVYLTAATTILQGV